MNVKNLEKLEHPSTRVQIQRGFVDSIYYVAEKGKQKKAEPDSFSESNEICQILFTK